MATESTLPAEMAEMIVQAERLMDAQTDAFELVPQLKEIRADLLRRTVELSDAWFKFGCLITATSQGHSRRVQ
jgi:hypothetical protein